MQLDPLQILHKLAVTSPQTGLFENPSDYLKWFLAQINDFLGKDIELRFTNVQYFSSDHISTDGFLNGRLLNIPTLIDLNVIGKNQLSVMLQDIAAFLTATSIVQRFHSEANRVTINTFKDKLKIETIRDPRLDVDEQKIFFDENENLITIIIPDLYDKSNSEMLLGEKFYSGKELLQEELTDGRIFLSGSILDNKLDAFFSSRKIQKFIQEVQKFLNSPEIVALIGKYIIDFGHSGFLKSEKDSTEQLRLFISTSLIHSWLKPNKYDYQLVVSKCIGKNPIAYGVLLVNSNSKLSIELLRNLQLALNIAFNNITQLIEGSSLIQKKDKNFNGNKSNDSKFVYSSNKMKAIDYEITKFARTDESVLLLGETGVGKDLIAYEIHNRSSRREKPFISVPLSSLSEQIIESEIFGSVKGSYTGSVENTRGKFDQANGGTLYLPEVSEIPLNIQIKLLEFLQYKYVSKVGGKKSKLDVRLIFASNSDLNQLREKGLLRNDFYHRILVLNILIPPLRERKEDIATLTNYFISKHSLRIFGEEYKISDDVDGLLNNLNWEGNVRQLENFIIRAIVNSDEKIISKNTLDKLLSQKTISNNGHIKEFMKDFKSTEKEFKKQYFLSLLQETNGCIAEIARISGLTRQAVYKILNELDIPH